MTVARGGVVPGSIPGDGMTSTRAVVRAKRTAERGRPVLVKVTSMTSSTPNEREGIELKTAASSEEIARLELARSIYDNDLMDQATSIAADLRDRNSEDPSKEDITFALRSLDALRADLEAIQVVLEDE